MKIFTGCLLVLSLLSCNSETISLSKPKQVVFPSPTPSPSPIAGPIDGTWKLTDLTCNGESAVGNPDLDFPTETVLSIQNMKGSLVEKYDSCSVTYSLVFSYPKVGQASVTQSYANCNPVNCSYLCDPESGDLTLTYYYARSGESLTVSVSEDSFGLCTDALPLGYMFKIKN